MTYNEFIQSCKTKRVDPEYHHKHHIVPQSVGGSNEPDNIILLSYTSHYIAHYLLAKEHPDCQEYVLAFKRMGTWESYIKRSYNYQKASRLPKSEEQKRKISESNKGIRKPSHTDEWKAQVSAKLKGRRFSEETRRKMSESKKGCVGNATGKHWFTDGCCSVLAFECPPGFTRGRCSRTK